MGLLTKRGRRLMQMFGAGACWGLCFALLTLSVVLHVDAPRGFGLAMCGVAVTWTTALVFARHTDLVQTAYSLGVEAGRDSVRRIH